jgi:predicted ribosomally synthesized peptide with SipW-like signal peptide
MKKMYKAMLLVLCAALLVAGSVMGTLAYLKDTKAVTNTFTVGKVEITLDEAKTNEYGVTLTGTDAARVPGNEYKLIPGHTYDKDPKITVSATSEDCWVFAKLENGLGANANFNIDTSKWTDLGNGVYAYNTKLSAGIDTTNSATLFTQFTFASTADPETYKNASIVITGYAVQADGFTTAQEAWAASGFATTANP